MLGKCNVVSAPQIVAIMIIGHVGLKTHKSTSTPCIHIHGTHTVLICTINTHLLYAFIKIGVRKLFL